MQVSVIYLEPWPAFLVRGNFLQVGRALRAVDARLKAEWMQWTEETTGGRLPPNRDENGDGAISSVNPESVVSGIEGHRQHLRAWCSKVQHTMQYTYTIAVIFGSIEQGECLDPTIMSANKNSPFIKAANQKTAGTLSLTLYNNNRAQE